jgi:hypothetical protein
MNAASLHDLYDPRFWKRCLEGQSPFIPDELLAQVAASAGVPFSFAQQRVHDYLAGRMAEIDNVIHPGTESIN